MPKIAKKILIAVGAVVAVSAALLLVLNLYLQSEAVQTRIREAAGKALGAPLVVRSTSFTPWGGFALKGLSVPDPEDPSKNLLDADSLRFRFAILPILSGKLVIRRVTLSNATIIARQNDDRQWAVLVPPPPQADIPVEIAPATAGKTEGAGSPRTMKVTVEKVRVQGLTAVFVDRKGRTVFRAEKGAGEASLGEGGDSSGTFRIGIMQIARSLEVKNFGGPFTWDGSRLDMPELTGEMAGGEISGNYRLDVNDTTEFALRLGLADGRIKKFARDLGANGDNASGTVNASLTLAGDPADTDTFAGEATVDMVGARFTPVDFLVQIGQLLSIDELQVLNLSEATSRFVIREGRVVVETMRLQSENLVIEGTGDAEFDGDLDMKGRLLVNRKLQGQLGGLLGKNFRDSDDPEYKQLKFSVTNTLSNPKTDLLDKIVGVRVGDDVGGLLRNLFRMKPGSDGN